MRADLGIHNLANFLQNYGPKKQEIDLFVKYSRVPIVNLLTETERKLLAMVEDDMKKGKEEHDRKQEEREKERAERNA